jgi:hypothetical protein
LENGCRRRPVPRWNSDISGTVDAPSRGGGYRFTQDVIHHNFGFRRVTHPRDAEIEALDDMLISLGATKLMAGRLMQDFPQHATACQAIGDLAADGEGDIRAQSRSSTSSGLGGTRRAARREWWRLSRGGSANPRVSC